VRIRGRLAALRGGNRNVLEGFVPLPGQEHRRLVRNPRNGPDTRVGEPCLVAGPILRQGQRDGDSYERKVALLLVQLQPDLARPGRDAGEVDADDELSRFDGGLERPAKELLRAKTAGAASASQLDLAVQSSYSRRKLGGRISVRKAPSESAAVSDRHVADLCSRLGKQRTRTRDRRIPLDAAMADERAEREHRVGLLHVVKAADPVQIDENARLGQSEVEERPQALAAGEWLRIAAEAGEQRDRFLDALGSVVVESVRLQPIVPRSSTETSWNGSTFSLPTSRIRSIES
jgi:hypothetical protein